MVEQELLIPKHGGYRKRKSFQVAQLVYDVTVRFCGLYVNRFSRTPFGAFRGRHAASAYLKVVLNSKF